MEHGNIASVKIEQFNDDGTFPNSRLPVLVYRAAVTADATTAERLERLFEVNGWPAQWRNGVYEFHHYHSTAHEALGIARGSARLMLGGPEGRALAVSAGDVLVIPAGVAHRRIEESEDFLIVGAYPPGQDWDLLEGREGERPQADENIARVPLPQTDPVGGPGGPLLEQWR